MLGIESDGVRGSAVYIPEMKQLKEKEYSFPCTVSSVILCKHTLLSCLNAIYFTLGTHILQAIFQTP